MKLPELMKQVKINNISLFKPFFSCEECKKSTLERFNLFQLTITNANKIKFINIMAAIGKITENIIYIGQRKQLK